MMPPHPTAASAAPPFRQEIWRQVLEVLRQAVCGFFRNNSINWSAAIAYYTLLSLFPLLLALGSVAALFVDRTWAVHRATLYLGDLLPRGSAAIERVVQQTITTGRGPGWWSLLPLCWTASLVFNAITRALNAVFGGEERAPVWQRLWLRLAMVLSVGGMFLGALATSALLHWLHAFLGFLPGREVLFAILLNLLPNLFILGALCVAYRCIPQRAPAWRAALWGAVVATLLFAGAKPVFLSYVTYTGRYTLIYGSLAGIVVVIFWTWLTAMIGLFGGQVAHCVQAISTEKQGTQQGVSPRTLA